MPNPRSRCVLFSLSPVLAVLLAAVAPKLTEAQVRDARIAPHDMRPFALLDGKRLDMPQRAASSLYGPAQAVCAVEDSPECVAAQSQISAGVEAFFKSAPASAVQIAVRKQGRFVYSKAFGSEDPKKQVPATNHSLFQIGSNTKKATAVAILRAVQDGAIGLDQTIDEILPDLTLARDPEWTKHATVRQLLSHQAGLWDYSGWIDAPDDADVAKYAYGTFAEHEWSTTPPGAVWNYSNAHFAVLGAVIEHVYGEPYRKVVERVLYEPLRMRDTYARRDEAVATGHAVWGYGLTRAALTSSAYDPWAIYSPPSGTEMPAPMEWVAPEDEEDNAFLRPAGFTWSTAEDECRMGSFLMSGNEVVLDETLRHEMTNPQAQTTPDPNGQHYSFGLAIEKQIKLGQDAYDIAIWDHDGETMRMISLFFAFPEQDLTFSLLTNSRAETDQAAMSWRLLALSVLRAYVSLPQAHTPAAPEPPDDGARYAGTYADPLGLGQVVLKWDGTKLTLTAPDLTAQGAKVGENLIIAQKNVLVGTIDGEQAVLQVWPSSSNDASYLVSRTDSFTRVADH